MGKTQSWKTFRMIMLGTFFVVLPLSFITPALPLITAHFNLQPGSAAWLSLGFAMGATVFQPIFGWMGDNFGRRKLLLFGLLIFTIGNIVMATAPAFTFVVIGRFFQGLASASVIPVGMAFAANAFNGEEQGKAFGYWGMIAAIAPIIGPIIGGILASSLGWQAIYYISALLSLLAFVICLFKLPIIKATASSSFDWGGTILLLLLMSGLLNVPTFVNSYGLTSFLPYMWLLLFAISAFFFIKHERKQASPLIDVKYAKTKYFYTPTLIVFFEYLSFQGALLLVSYFITQVQGKEPTVTGIVLIPLFFMLAAGSTISGKLMEKFSAKFMVGVGLVTYLIGLAGLTLLHVNTGVAYLLILASLMGLGLGLSLPALIAVVVSKADIAKMGSTTSSYNTCKDIGAPFGSSFAIVLYSLLSQSQSLISSITTTVTVLLVIALISLIPLYFMPNYTNKKTNSFAKSVSSNE